MTGSGGRLSTRPGIAAAAALVALIAAACGGGAGGSGVGPTGAAGPTTAVDADPTTSGGTGVTQGPGTATKGTACALLTDAQILQITGNPVTSKEQSAESGLLDDGCRWVLSNPDALVPPEIHFEVLFDGGRDYYDRYFEPYKNDDGNKPMEGLGDAAIDQEFGAILVLSGDALFSLQDLAFGSEKNHAEELARQVIANLGS